MYWSGLYEKQLSFLPDLLPPDPRERVARVTAQVPSRPSPLDSVRRSRSQISGFPSITRTTS